MFPGYKPCYAQLHSGAQEQEEGDEEDSPSSTEHRAATEELADRRGGEEARVWDVDLRGPAAAATVSACAQLQRAEQEVRVTISTTTVTEVSTISSLITFEAAFENKINMCIAFLCLLSAHGENGRQEHQLRSYQRGTCELPTLRLPD